MFDSEYDTHILDTTIYLQYYLSLLNRIIENDTWFPLAVLDTLLFHHKYTVTFFSNSSLDGSSLGTLGGCDVAFNGASTGGCNVCNRAGSVATFWTVENAWCSDPAVPRVTIVNKYPVV